MARLTTCNTFSEATDVLFACEHVDAQSFRVGNRWHVVCDECQPQNMPRNPEGLTFSEWHASAGWTISELARCNMRLFRLLHSAWQRGDSADHWAGQRHSELWFE